jgi:hypothetical protein
MKPAAAVSENVQPTVSTVPVVGLPQALAPAYPPYQPQPQMYPHAPQGYHPMHPAYQQPALYQSIPQQQMLYQPPLYVPHYQEGYGVPPMAPPSTFMPPPMYHPVQQPPMYQQQQLPTGTMYCPPPTTTMYPPPTAGPE